MSPSIGLGSLMDLEADPFVCGGGEDTGNAGFSNPKGRGTYINPWSASSTPWSSRAQSVVPALSRGQTLPPNGHHDPIIETHLSRSHSLTPISPLQSFPSSLTFLADRHLDPNVSSPISEKSSNIPALSPTSSCAFTSS